MRLPCLALLMIAALLVGQPAVAAQRYALSTGLEGDKIVEISGSYVAHVRLTRTLMNEPQVVVDGALGLGNATMEKRLEGGHHLAFSGNVDFNNAAIRHALGMLRVGWIPWAHRPYRKRPVARRRPHRAG